MAMLRHSRGSQKSSRSSFPEKKLSTAWRSKQLQQDLSFSKKGPGEILFALPGILKNLQRRNRGKAADALLKASELSEVQATVDAIEIISSTKVRGTNPMEHLKQASMKALELYKELKKLRGGLKEGTTTHAGSVVSRISKTTGARASSPKKNVLKYVKIGTRPRLRRPKKLSSLTASSTDGEFLTSFQSVDSEHYEQIIKEVGAVVANHAEVDIFAIVLFLVSAATNEFLPSKYIKPLLAASASPIGKSKINLNNMIADMLNSMKAQNMTNVVALEALCNFLCRNSTAVELHDKAGSKVLFGDSRPASQALFKNLVRAVPFLVSQDSAKKFGRVRDYLPDDEDTVLRKMQLKQFYESDFIDGGWYKPIIDELFDLFHFQHIALGIYRKYLVWVPDWRDQARPLLNESEIPGEGITSESPIEDAVIRARWQPDEDHIEETSEKMYDKILKHEFAIVSEEVDFNERLRELRRLYIPEINKKFAKSSKDSKLKLTKDLAEMCFGEEFQAVIDSSNRLAVRLEVLNLVKAPLKYSKHNSVNLHQPNLAEAGDHFPNFPDSNLTRLEILCEIYLSFAEEMYNCYAPFVSRKALIESELTEALDAVREKEKKSRGNILSTFSPSKSKTHNKLQRDSIHSETTQNSKSRAGSTGAGRLHDLKSKSPEKGLSIITSTVVSTQRSSQSKKTASSNLGKLGSFFGEGAKNFYQLFEEAQQNSRNGCLVDHDLIEIVLSPAVRAERLKHQFYLLEKLVDKSDPAKPKLTILKEKFADMASNFNQEAQSWQKIIEKMGESRLHLRHCKSLYLPRLKFTPQD